MEENIKKGSRIYLDDTRTPIDKDWIIVRNYEEFVQKIEGIGLKNIETISFDHDLGETAMKEYFNNVAKNYVLDYKNIEEKTGMDCLKWLINHFYELYPKRLEMARFDKKNIPINFPKIYVHSANPVGAGNIMGYCNNFFLNEGEEQSCIRVKIEHKV